MSWATVVVNYGSSLLLAENLVDPSASSGDRMTIVVDNFTDDGELAAVRDLAGREGWVVVASPRNVGFGAAVNLGAAEAFRLGCEGVLLLNPDARIDARSAEELMSTSLADPLTVASPLIVDSTGAVVFRGAEVSLTTGRIRGLGPVASREEGDVLGASRLAEPSERWLTGACLAISRELFTRLGGFDDRYFMYWEDIDLSLRALRSGARLTVRLDLEAVHDEGGTQGDRVGSAKSRLYYYYNARNRLLFAARHVPRQSRRAWVLATPAVTREIYLRGGRRQLLTAPANLVAVVRGALAGLSALQRSRSETR